MIFSVGTHNPAKLSAAELAIQQILSKFERQREDSIRIRQTSTSTSVPDMPLTIQDLMQGALERALFTYKAFPESDFALGLEGGVYRVPEQNAVFLQSWAYAFNGKNGFFGSSVALPLPASITAPLFEQGLELSTVIDDLSGKEDVRSNEGTFGILTRNLISRSSSFVMAITAALTPFFNRDYYDI